MVSILIVDDDPDILHSLALALEDEGFFLRLAGNGRDAIDLHQAVAADLIVSDMMMPVMDGRALVEELRRRNDDTPVILMSAGFANGTGQRGVDFMAKPFNLDRLFILIHHMLDTP